MEYQMFLLTFVPRRMMVKVGVRLKELEPDKFDSCESLANKEGLTGIKRTRDWLYFNVRSRQDLEQHDEFFKKLFSKSYEMQKKS